MVKLNREEEEVIQSEMDDDAELTAQTAGDNVGIVVSPLESSPHRGANGNWVRFDVVCEKGLEHPSFYRFQAILRGHRALEAQRCLCPNHLVFLRGDYVNQHMNVKYFRPLSR